MGGYPFGDMSSEKRPLWNLDRFKLEQDMGVGRGIDLSLKTPEGDTPDTFDGLGATLSPVLDPYQDASSPLICKTDREVDEPLLELLSSPWLSLDLEGLVLNVVDDFAIESL